MASTSADMLKLDTLPNEILIKIFKIFSLRPLTADHYPDVDAVSKNRQILKNLCLTNRELTGAASFVLHETVILWRDNERDRNNLVFLLRSLTENANLRPVVNHISCFINLKEFYGQIIYDEFQIARSWKYLLKDNSFTVPAKDLALFRCTSLVDENGKLSKSVTGEQIFGAILCLTSGLGSLFIQCPSNTWTLPSQFSPRYDTLQSILSAASGSRSDGGPLHRLHNVRLQPDCDINYPWPISFDSEDENVHLNLLPVLFEVPDLRSLSLGGVRGDWPTLPTSLQSLEVNRSLISTQDIDALETLPNLRTLILRRSQMRLDNAYPNLDVFMDSLLHKFAKKLTTLEVRVRGYSDVESDIPLSWPPQYTDFSSLKELAISFCGIQLRQLVVGWKTLASRLPSSLERLEIYGHTWRKDQIPIPPYGDRFAECLRLVAKACRKRCPRLKIVAYRHDDFLIRRWDAPELGKSEYVEFSA
ncbi:hypothetical protein F4779DRAFT_614877 [Xylariaceae sp. FL0662B]|nr:hypothetical protein F4779DRAFT_614877 [Xylariaceae sp. FL0662B]